MTDRLQYLYVVLQTLYSWAVASIIGSPSCTERQQAVQESNQSIFNNFLVVESWELEPLQQRENIYFFFEMGAWIKQSRDFSFLLPAAACRHLFGGKGLRTSYSCRLMSMDYRSAYIYLFESSPRPPKATRPPGQKTHSSPSLQKMPGTSWNEQLEDWWKLPHLFLVILRTRYLVRFFKIQQQPQERQQNRSRSPLMFSTFHLYHARLHRSNAAATASSLCKVYAVPRRHSNRKILQGKKAGYSKQQQQRDY